MLTSRTWGLVIAVEWIAAKGALVGDWWLIQWKYPVETDVCTDQTSASFENFGGALKKALTWDLVGVFITIAAQKFQLYQCKWQLATSASTYRRKGGISSISVKSYPTTWAVISYLNCLPWLWFYPTCWHHHTRFPPLSEQTLTCFLLKEWEATALRWHMW